MKQTILYLLLICFMVPAATTLVAQPSNDNCTTAISLGTLPSPPACGNATTGTKKGDTVTVSGTNVGATPSNPYPYISTCPPTTGSPPDDVWYSFVASSYQAVIFITGATFTNPIITVWEGSCATLGGIGCVSGAAGAAHLVLYALTPGNTYYIQVSGIDSTQTGTFNLHASSETDCANCLIGAKATVSPLPVNGYYPPGTVVTFCDSIYSWDETSANWFHGIVPTFGSGWNLSTLTIGTPPPSCSQDGGFWAWYPHGDTSSYNHSIWGTGFYYETSTGNNNFVIDNSPGDNYGDEDATNSCTWVFCVTITTNNTGTCAPGSNLDMTWAVSGDGQSGSWTSSACQNDPVTDLYAIGACCPPTMTSTAATCANATGGTATATPVGNNSPWTYQWSNGFIQTHSTSPSTATGLSQGIDTVTVTDASNCSSVATVSVGGPTGIVAGPDQTICQNATATMAASGTGTWSAVAGNPATVTFANPALPTTTVTGFSVGGVYTLEWTVGGCSSVMTLTVDSVPNPTVNNPSICSGDTAILTATGGGTYLWSNSDTSQSITATSAGTYSVTVTRGADCSATASGTVTYNTAPTPTVNSPSICPGDTATLTATGGVSYLWSTGATTASIMTQTSGTYTVTATGPTGCTASVSGIVTVSNVLNPTVNSPAVCSGDTATLTANGGSTYLWNTGATTQSIGTTTAGTYTVTVSTGSCSGTASGTVTINPLPTATPISSPSVCTANNGMVIANPAAGTPAYTYAWSPPGGSTDTLANISPGTYTVTVTDANQCSVTASGIVALSSFTITVDEVSQHNLKCNNDASGAIYINAVDNGTSGPFTFTYAWSSGSSSQNLTSVQAGPYTVTVTDQYGCSGTLSDTLTQPSALSGTTQQSNPVCFGSATGTATVTPIGGSIPYAYAWGTTPPQDSAQANNLAAGSYTVTVTDDSLCTITATVTLTDPAAITFGTSTLTSPSCFGDTNGSALVAPQNGVGLYSYSWNDPNSQTTNPATGLGAGTYKVTVTDANGCTATTSVTISQPAQISVSASSTNATCYGYSNGSATVTVTGGTTPYQYLWTNSATTATITGLPMASYGVTVTDNNGCTGSGFTTVSQPAPTVVSLISIRTNCANSSDGSITATGAGGTGTFTYTLENASGTILQSGSTSGSFTGLASGLYTVLATDQNNCQASDTITVPQAPIDVYTATADTTSCYGVQYADGIIHVQGYTIPNGPFQYAVDGGPFQYIPDFFSLAAGPHQVTAQDNFGCDTTFTVIVGEPLPATVQILPGDSTIAPGNSIQLSTAFSPYSTDSIKAYTWSPGTGLSCMDCPSPTASPYASQNTYTVTVTYNAGCTTTASIQINTTGNPPTYIPNAFTPNGDGIDDIWSVFGTGIKDIKATVFNRWGEKVYETTNQSDGWDGTYRGTAQPTGVYVYFIQVVYLSGQEETKQGSLTLIR